MSAYPGQDGLRTPLKVARSNGASGTGVRHWWIQRVTAVALIPLSIWFLFLMGGLLHATYPEVLALLQAADRQRNLPGAPGSGTPTLVVDALPTALPAYAEAQLTGRDATAKSDPALQKTGAEKPAPRKKIIDRVFRRGGK